MYCPVTMLVLFLLSLVLTIMDLFSSSLILEVFSAQHSFIQYYKPLSIAHPPLPQQQNHPLKGTAEQLWAKTKYAAYVTVHSHILFNIVLVCTLSTNNSISFLKNFQS